MRLASTLSIALFVLLAGCLEGGDGPDTGGGDEPVTEPVERIEQGQHSGVQGLAERVIETEAAWAEFWEQHTSERTPAEDRPDVDFNESRVIAVVLEEKPNGCYGVEVENVTTQAGVTTVEYVVFTPPEDAFCAEVITTPYDIVKIPAGDTTVAFDRTTRPLPSPEGAPQGGDADAETGGNETGPEPVERIDRGQQSGIEGLAERVLETEEAWAAFWANHTANRVPAPERPNVDFNESRVIAVVLEPKGNGCWATGITNVTTAEATTTVEYVVYSPPPDAICPAVMTTPYDIVKIPAGETDVQFERSEEQGPPPE